VLWRQCELEQWVRQALEHEADDTDVLLTVNPRWAKYCEPLTRRTARRIPNHRGVLAILGCKADSPRSKPPAPVRSQS
jgi:hypothetical protein